MSIEMAQAILQAQQPLAMRLVNPNLAALLGVPTQFVSSASSSMLSQVIEASGRAADSVMRMATLPGVSDAVRAHAAQFINSTIPAARSMQDAVRAFTSASTSTVTRLLGEISNGVMPPSLLSDLRNMAQAAQAASSRLSEVSGQMNQARDTMAQDHVALANKQVECRANLAALNSQAQHYRDEAEALRKRDLATTIVGAIFPLVKVADEIASLIQYQKSTEAALQEAQQSVASAEQQVQSLDGAVAQLGGLMGVLETLVGGIQNVANALSVVNGRLASEDHFAAITMPATALLMLNALKSSLDVLCGEVA
jgi:hypothetical protein